MRTSLLALALLLTTSLLPVTGGAIVDFGVLDGACAKLATVSPSSTAQAQVKLPPAAAALNFQPSCVVLESGGNVTFHSLDTGRHRPLDRMGGFCFDLGDTSIGWERSLVLSFVDGVLRANGKACTFAFVPLDATTVAVPYQCGIHDNMKGTIALKL